jgi:hypothetical protein
MQSLISLLPLVGLASAATLRRADVPDINADISLNLGTFSVEQKDSGVAIDWLAQRALNRAMKLVSDDASAPCNKNNIKRRKEW